MKAQDDRKVQDLWILEDDGTLDTVLSCVDCGTQVRFSEVDRDESGAITPEGWIGLCEDAEEFHWQDEPRCDRVKGE